MNGPDAMKGLNRALRDLSQARSDLRDRMTAAMAFRAALTGKAYDFTESPPDGVSRARRHELETSLDCLRDLEASVDSARRAVARAERKYLAENQVRQDRPRQGA